MALVSTRNSQHESEIHKRCMATKLTKCLDLSGFRLYTIPKSVYKIGRTLLHLYLHNCSLQDGFPFEIIHLPHLQTLDLSENNLTVIPDSFCMIAKRLEVLDVSYNQLYRLPGSLDELVMLKELNAAHNKLIYVPSEIGKLAKIQDIDLNHNDLLGLPMALFENRAMFSLQSLNVSNNQLTELPYSLGNVKGLQSLKVSNNKLKSVPASLKQLTKLATFHYTGDEWYAFRYRMSLHGKSYGVKALLMIDTLSL